MKEQLLKELGLVERVLTDLIDDCSPAISPRVNQLIELRNTIRKELDSHAEES